MSLLLLITYNILRLSLMRMCHVGRVRVHWLQRISPLCSLKLYDKGVIVIDRNVDFAAYCDFEVHGHGVLKIGAKTYFNRFCMISVHDRVTIGEGCMFGPGVKIFDNNHKHSPEEGVSHGLTTAPISIGNHCWIASDVIILKGARIGNNCVIGARVIVRGVIPDGSVVYS